jgi:hypothetical protein
MGGKCYVLASDVLTALRTESKRLFKEHDGHAAQAVATVTDSLLDEVSESQKRADDTHKRATAGR